MNTINLKTLLESRLIIFDLDGTLCETHRDIYAAYYEAIEKLEIARESVNDIIIGPPLETMIRRSVGERVEQLVVDAIGVEFRKFYDRIDFEHSHLYPGTKELLVRLKETEKILAVATLKREIPTLRLLEKKGIHGFFEKIISCDSGGTTWNKAGMIQSLLESFNVRKEKCMFFGDTPGDVLAGKQIGVKTVAMLNGYAPREELLALQPDFTCEHLRDI